MAEPSNSPFTGSNGADHEARRQAYQAALLETLNDPGLLNAATGFAALAAGVGSFFGLRQIMGDGGAETWVLPFIAAAAISFSLFALWHRMLRTVPLLMSPSNRALALAVAAGLALTAIAISSWFLATAVGSDAAQEQHASTSLAAFKKGIVLGNDAVQHEASLIAEVEEKSSVYFAMAADERGKGTYSGSRGPGEVFVALITIAESLARVAEEMTQRRDGAQAAFDRAHRQVSELERVIASDAPIDSRTRRFADLTVPLARDVEALWTARVGEPLLQAPTELLTAQGVTNEQARVLAQLEQQSRVWRAQLASRLQEMRDRRERWEGLTFAALNPGVAVVQYAGQVPGAWAAAIGIDLIPLFALLILLLGHIDTRPPHASPPSFAEFTTHPLGNAAFAQDPESKNGGGARWQGGGDSSLSS